MMNQKLQEIGNKLAVSEHDIKTIQKTHTLSNIKYYITAVIIATLAFILGFFAGQGTCPASPAGYPFAGGLTALGASGSQKRTTKLAGLLLAAIGFFIALKTTPIFGQAIDYNVYSKK
ncbi:MAG: hypothetical protein ABIG84_01995 [archaeon]